MKIATLSTALEALTLPQFPDAEVFFPDPAIMIVKGGPDPSEVDGATQHALDESGWKHSGPTQMCYGDDVVVRRPYPFWYLSLV